MAICCSTGVLGTTTAIWLLISLALLGSTVFAFTSDDSGLFLLPPPELYAGLMTLFGLWTIVSFSGFAARQCHIEVFLVMFILLGFITMIATLIGGIFIILYSNEVATFDNVDAFASEQQSQIENALVEYANDPANAEAWLDTQDTLKCCGFDMKTLLEPGNEAIITGAACQEPAAANKLAAILAQGCGPEGFSPECEEDLKTQFEIEDDFFCKDAIGFFFQDQIVFVALTIGLVSLLQVSSWVAGCRLYWVPFHEGGFADGYADGYDGTLPTQWKGEGGGGNMRQTSAFGRGVQQWGNRVSSRMGFGGGGYGQGGGAQIAALGPNDY